MRLVRLTVDESNLDVFDALFRKHHSDIEAQPGCLGVDLLTENGNACVRATLSMWDSEASLNAYRKSELFGVVWPATKRLFGAPPEVWTYEMVEQD